jgi:hypothetical protein
MNTLNLKHKHLELLETRAGSLLTLEGAGEG